MSGQGVMTPGLDRGLVPRAGSADSACLQESSRSAPQSWRGGLTSLTVWPMFILGNVGSLIPVQRFSPGQTLVFKNSADLSVHPLSETQNMPGRMVTRRGAG